jgi:lipoate-protein ligase A
MKWISSFTCPFTNLAIESHLLLNSPKRSAHGLFLYRNAPSVIIGRNQNPWRECNVNLGTTIVRRQSGGGCVYHDLGNTNYSIFMPRSLFSRTTHLPIIADAVRSLGIHNVEINARHDIVVGERKVSGSAYKVVRETTMHHGTMLISSNLDKLGKVLRGNGERIVGKGVASHRSPVTRLNAHSPGASHEGFCTAMLSKFSQMHDAGNKVDTVVIGQEFVDSNPGIQKIVDELTSWDWIWAQTPEFKVGGEHASNERVEAMVKEGLIASLHIGECEIHGASGISISNPY